MPFKVNDIFYYEVKRQLKLDDKTYRQFFHIFNKKEANIIWDEFLYMKLIYEIDNKILFKCVLNKYIKIKIYNIQFIDNHSDIKKYIEYVNLLRECRDLGIDIDE